MKLPILILLILCFSVFNTQQSLGQTTIQGKVLSADGSPIPKTVISIRAENPRDIFSGYYEDVMPAKDGSYQLVIRDPGMYRITFRGVFHSTLTVHVLIYDQPSVHMDILLLPIYYSDGAYFGNEEYLKWIRIYGSFNEYSYLDGKSFSLNDDGSISAFIPVNSDTLRYMVRGLTYGRGPTPLPQADEYNFHEAHGFESVLYTGLPEDSLEIRYSPGKDIPYERYLPAEVNPQRIILRGFISFENPKDQYWVEPLSLIRSQYISGHAVDREFSSGVPAEVQIEMQKKYLGGLVEIDLAETEGQIRSDLDKPDLHPQQHVLLMLAYAGVLSQVHLRTFHWRQPGMEEPPDITVDMEVIMSILDVVPPIHPAWSLNPGLANVLLTVSNNHPKFVDYFNEIVKHHPNEQAVHSAAVTLVRFLALDYDAVEMMPVYQSIVERYGEGDLARSAHQVFNGRHFEHQSRDNR